MTHWQKQSPNGNVEHDGSSAGVIMNPTKGRYKISKSLFKAFYSRISVTNGEPQALPGN